MSAAIEELQQQIELQETVQQPVSQPVPDPVPRIATVLVTCGPLAQLQDSLYAAVAQSQVPHRVYVIDNASSDDTSQFLTALARRDHRLVHVRSNEDIGPAGAFSLGIQHAFTDGFEWLWLLDDTCFPEADALEVLLEQARDTNHMYASTEIEEPLEGNAGQVAWRKSRRAGRARTDRSGQVATASFRSLLLHRDLVNRIGWSAAEFFVAGDDVEYCLRARAAGASVWRVGESVFHRPDEAPAGGVASMRTPARRRMPAWRRYYAARNAVVTAGRHRMVTVWLGLVPRACSGFLWSVLLGPSRFRQVWNAIKGVRDGLGGRMGRRVRVS